MRERRSFLTPSSFDLYALVRLRKYLWVFLNLKPSMFYGLSHSLAAQGIVRALILQDFL